MVSLYFGVPGCGKTTYAVYLARKHMVSIASGKSPYKHVYVNFETKLPFVETIPFSWLGKYDLSDSLIIIDEATIFMDNRDFKHFSNELRDFILLHRHYHCDIIVLCQQWSGVDLKVRAVTEKVYYIKKGLLPHVSICYELRYGIYIPSTSADKDGEYGEISQGYKLPPLFSRIFARRIYRKPLYRYFDSFSKKELPPVPGVSEIDEFVK